MVSNMVWVFFGAYYGGYDGLGMIFLYHFVVYDCLCHFFVSFRSLNYCYVNCNNASFECLHNNGEVEHKEPQRAS